MKRLLCFVLSICVLYVPATVYGRSEGTLGQISDILCIATPLLAVGSSLVLESPADTGLFVVQFGVQKLFVHGMKETLSKTSIGERPNDKDRNGNRSMGFISFHASSTAGGAIKLWRLFPDNYWVKGFAIASVTTVSYQRTQGGYHSELQVGLGVATAFLFDYIGQKITKRLHKVYPLTFQLAPTTESDGIKGLLTLRF